MTDYLSRPPSLRLSNLLIYSQFGQKSHPEFDESHATPVTRPGNVDTFVERNGSVRENHNTIRQQHCLIDIVSDQQHRRTVPAAELLQQSVHFGSSQRIESTEWLIQQEQLWLAHQCSGESHPLRLATRECGGPRPGVAQETHLVKSHPAATPNLVG
jgi:hypothetical protein